MHQMIDEILSYWFGDADPNAEESMRFSLWFGGSPELDTEIRTRFGPWITRAGLGELEDWKQSPRGRLAWTLLLDQFTRNAYRDTVRMYAFDLIALHSTREAIQLGQDRALPAIQRAFLYLPLEHAEELPAQEECLAQYRALAAESHTPAVAKAMAGMLDYAVRHERVVRRFGRFPHRNDIMLRATTDEERAFLASSEAPF